MLLEKIRKLFLKYEKFWPIFLISLFSILFFLTRLPGLKNDVINPDGSLWHYRSEQFIVGIKNKQFEKTYQHYQPGVTLMWITGPAVEIYKRVTGITAYDVGNFQSFDLISKIAIVSVQYILSVFIIFILAKIVGFYISFFTISLFSFEPFFLANSRLYHMDVLLTLLLFVTLVLSFLNMKKPRIWKSAVIGFFLALSFLAKSISIGALFFILFYSVTYFIYSKQKEKIFPVAVPLLVSFVFFTFLLFPALWVRPWYYLSDMFSEVLRVGVRKGHDQIMFGVPTTNAGLLFYPLVSLMKVSPLLLIGIFSCLYYFVKFTKSIVKTFKDTGGVFFVFTLYLAIFYVGYILGMSFPAKKVDRYILVMYPLFSYCAVIGYQRIFQNLKSLSKRYLFLALFIFLISVFWVRPLINLYPWYFTYTSPIFGSSVNANGVIAQKPYGVGIVDLKETIVSRYSDKLTGEWPDLGFYDTQPIKTIYPNSKVFDVRVYGPSNYDLVILGINEEMPEKILKSTDYKFEKDYSMWINDLEYWTIYIRKDLP
jgi:cbb3-type cytochrome oxidase subunit 3